VPGDEISIVYPTHRLEPHFEWFADSLAAQLRGDAPEVIAVDGLYSRERGDAMRSAVADRFPFRHVPAKPNAFNGPYRRTRRRHYTALSSARNTGIVHATQPYVVFADDLSVLMPGWWDEVRIAAAGEYVVSGAYHKRREMQVRDGLLESSVVVQSSIESRWDLGDDARPVRIVGGRLYGCSFGAPRELHLAVNGCDELCNSFAGEDYDLGIRFELLGEPIFFSRRMLSIESEDDHFQEPEIVRLQRTLDEAAYMTRLREFGVTRRSTDGPFDSTHFLLDRLLGTRDPRAAGNHYELRALEPETLEATASGLPTHLWLDGQPLEEM
jgi:glycosyltransferase involved in cell wall biosynthesis